MAHINGSGIQQHSDGGHLPYVVYMLGEYTDHGALVKERIIVSLAGEPLTEAATWREGHALALEFKRRDVRDSVTARFIRADWADAVAHLVDHPALIADAQRERDDHLMMYGDSNHVPLTGQDMLAWKRAEARKFEETESAYQKREADLAAAREEFYEAAETHWPDGLVSDRQSPEALAFEQWNERQLARRALGIIE